MKIGSSLFKSKVAQRIFFLFVCCALIPITVLSVLSFMQVSKELKEQSVARLQKAAKAHGLSIYERLVFLESDLHLTSSLLARDIEILSFKELSKDYHNSTSRRFHSVSVLSSSIPTQHLYGQLEETVAEELKTSIQLNDQKATLYFKFQPPSFARVFMVEKIDLSGRNPILLVGEIDTTYLWGIGHENTLPPATDLCIVDQSRNVIVSSFQVPSQLLHGITFADDQDATIRWFEYSQDAHLFFTSYWPMFLKSRFVAPTLDVVLRQDRQTVFSPLIHFKKIFPLVVLLSFWIVLFLSLTYIRKSLVPLEKLKEGTLQVAQKNFTSHVTVTSGDEFEELAQSFNEMAGQLNQHFKALTARSDIDRAILSSLKTKEIIETALQRIRHFFKSNGVSIGILRSRQPDSIRTYVNKDDSEDITIEEFLKVSIGDTSDLLTNSEYSIVDLTQVQPAYLSTQFAPHNGKAVVFPLFLEKTLSGVMAIYYHDEKACNADDLYHARQLADQVAVALSNAYLIEDLEELNWGTLEALARTVDAKSAWTAGHSERVADYAIKIARALGQTQKEINALQRAAFLHDIGKIGIPVAILDKPSSLNDEEYELVKDHPSIGAKILEPIAAYANVIPMVHQHHERYDGKGYPNGLSGENITIGARILAVADVFDAVASDRPYRQGWVKEKAISLIRDNAGKDFDPKVVEAFLSILT